MNYPELKEVIAHILHEPCPNCGKKYEEKNLHILSTTQSEGIFFVTCAKCPSKIIINVKFNQLNTTKASGQTRKHRKLGIRRSQSKKITSNDYLDIHNFLKTFNGNFKDFFTRE